MLSFIVVFKYSTDNHLFSPCTEWTFLLDLPAILPTEYHW